MMPKSLGEVVLDDVATWKEAPPNALELMKEALWILGPKHTGGGEDHARAVFEAFLDRGWTDPTPDARYAFWNRIPSGPLEEALGIFAGEREVYEVVLAAREAYMKRTLNRSLAELVATSRTGAKTVIATLRRARDGEVTEGASRVGGALPGLSAGRWPLHGQEPMRLVLVLSRADAPTLSSPGVAVFAHNPDLNSASRPGTDETAVLPLTEEELASSSGGTSIVAEKIEVPSNLWTSRTLAAARTKLFSLPGFAGGKPIWLQRAEHSGGFVLQAAAELVPMNLGDGGVLYVFDDTAFWQCH